MSRQLLGGGHHGGLAVFVQQLGHPPLTQPVGAHLAADVAHHHLRRPAVGMDQPFQLAHRPARVHELHRRQVQALLKNLPGSARAAAGDGASDVALVGHAGAEAYPFALVEDRRQHAHVRGVGAAAAVGVIDDVGVALPELFRGKPFEQALGTGGECPHMERQHHVLGDDLRLGVEDGATGVVGFADDGGEAGAEEGGLHLLHDAVEGGADDLDGDGVGGHARPGLSVHCLDGADTKTLYPSFPRNRLCQNVIPSEALESSLLLSVIPGLESGNPGGVGRGTPFVVTGSGYRSPGIRAFAAPQ